MAHCVIEKSLNSGIRILNSIPAISDCVIRGNSAANGGAINTDSPLKLDNCLVLNNTANSRGGGIYSTAPLSLLNCIVSTNSASVEGGGISSGANLILQSSLILGNSTAGIRGGGISSGAGSVHRNSIIAANASGSQGAGLYSTGGDALVENCTIAFNKPDGLGSDTNGTKVINSIVWGNTTTQIGGTTNVTYCDVQGGMAGLGNKNASPIFLSSSDLIIVPGSPCINAGNTNAAYTNVFFPPSLGKIHNDMGAHGGPGAGARLRARYNQQMEVVFLSGVPGYSYQIQASTDLSAWQTVEQVQIAHLGDYATFLEPSTNTIPFRFYRLNVGQ